MKRLFIILATAALLASCKGTWLMYDESQTPVIYFQEAVQTHSSSFALIPDDEIIVKDSVYVMGIPADHDRKFCIEYIDAQPGQTFSTGTVTYPVVTARPGVDFEVGDLVIPAGRVNSSIKLTIHRQKEMSDSCYMLIGIRLIANEEFKPCATDSTSTQKILSPVFYYYVTDGEPSCPTWWRASTSAAPGWNYNWGNFYPQKFRKLLEYYHATAETCPAFYAYCVEHYGYYLDADPDKDLNNNMNTFWRQAYMAAWAKYIAMPLYDYYKAWYAEHPDDPNFEVMGDENVNITQQLGWGDPMSGKYGFLN